MSQQSLHAQPAPFVNFETAPVHPVDLSPDGHTLAVCNLPDYRIELFDVSSGTPQSIGAVPVGADPVSVRWRTTNELWVVNYISSSVNVVDVARKLVVDRPCSERDACRRHDSAHALAFNGAREVTNS